MAKTVYVLGAGFSKPAGFPLQGELLQQVLDASLDEILFVGKDILSEPRLPFAKIREFRERITDFVASSFPNRETVSLEDVFTLLDQTISGRAHFAKYPEAELRSIHRAFVQTVLFALHVRSESFLQSDEQMHRRLAANWLLQRLQSGQPGDPFSVVSLNWDSLVEDSIFRILRETGGIRDGCALADIDYCVYTRRLPGSVHTPSTKQKAAGIYNIKVLKLHGSATWLRCPCSNHIYTGLGSSQSALDLYVKEQRSPFIDQFKDPREADQPSILEPFIITPTFSKVFDLPHIQTTWHNAFVELREADEVVFIGYSLPEADYHFSTLLRRAIRSTTPVRVILHSSDDPDADDNVYFKPKASNPDEAERARDPKAIYPEDRYRQVFHEDRLCFDYRGVEGFIADIAPEATHADTLKTLRDHFDRVGKEKIPRQCVE